MSNNIFLCGASVKITQRDELISALKINVVESCKDSCNIHLYILTEENAGIFSMAEVSESATSAGHITVFHVIPDGFRESIMSSFNTMVNLVLDNGGIAYIDPDLYRTSTILNTIYK
jgi:hypothetical protein